MDYNQEDYSTFYQSQINNDFNLNQFLQEPQELEENNINNFNPVLDLDLDLNDQSLLYPQSLQQQPLLSTNAISDQLIDPSLLLVLPQQNSTTPLIQVNTSTPSPSPSPSASTSTSSLLPPTGKRLPSCSACRMRRVKCERIGNSIDCNKCLEKGLNCVPIPKNKNRNVIRTGKRIEQVQALFGKESNDVNTVDTSTTTTTTTTKKRKLLSHDSLSNTSVVARLVTSELEGVLSASLLDLYYKLPQSRIPILDGLDFRTTFERAGRRISQMESQSEVLCSVILSVAARVSSHPLLIGANPPNSLQLANAYLNGQDLTEYGKKRESACIALTENAMKLADMRGTMRIPSLESIGTLLILEGLVIDREDGEISARSYSAAYLSHVRYILENAESDSNNKIPLMDSGIGWMIYIKDSIACATTGASPAFSQDDIPLLRRSTSPDITPLTEIFDGNERLVRPLKFWAFFHSYLFHLTETANMITSTLSSPRARRNARLDLTSIENLIFKINLALHANSFLRDSALSLYGPYEFASDEAKLHYGFVGAMTSARYGLAFLVEQFLSRHLTKKEISFENLARLSEIGKGGDEMIQLEEENRYWSQVMKFYKETLDKAFFSAREVIRDLRRQQQKAGVGVGIMSGIQHLYSRLPDIAILISRHPTIEEPGGNDSTFTFEQKLQDLKTVLTSLYTIGFSFPRLSSSIPIIQAEIEKVNLAQFLYQYDSSASTSILSPPSLPATASPLDEFQIRGGIDWTFGSFSTNTTNESDKFSERILEGRTFDEDSGIGDLSSVLENPKIFDINETTNRTNRKVEVGEVDDVLIDLLSNLLR